VIGVCILRATLSNCQKCHFIMFPESSRRPLFLEWCVWSMLMRFVVGNTFLFFSIFSLSFLWNSRWSWEISEFFFYLWRFQFQSLFFWFFIFILGSYMKFWFVFNFIFQSQYVIYYFFNLILILLIVFYFLLGPFVKLTFHFNFTFP
jgi:hypothetical protein